jgi:hypothetical protein
VSAQLFFFSAICSAELFTNCITTVATAHFQNGGVALNTSDATVITADNMKAILLIKTSRPAIPGPVSFGRTADPQLKHAVSPDATLELHSRQRSITLASLTCCETSHHRA